MKKVTRTKNKPLKRPTIHTLAAVASVLMGTCFLLPLGACKRDTGSNRTDAKPDALDFFSDLFSNLGGKVKDALLKTRRVVPVPSDEFDIKNRDPLLPPNDPLRAWSESLAAQLAPLSERLAQPGLKLLESNAFRENDALRAALLKDAESMKRAFPRGLNTQFSRQDEWILGTSPYAKSLQKAAERQLVHIAMPPGHQNARVSVSFPPARPLEEMVILDMDDTKVIDTFFLKGVLPPPANLSQEERQRLLQASSLVSGGSFSVQGVPRALVDLNIPFEAKDMANPSITLALFSNGRVYAKAGENGLLPIVAEIATQSDPSQMPVALSAMVAKIDARQRIVSLAWSRAVAGNQPHNAVFETLTRIQSSSDLREATQSSLLNFLRNAYGWKVLMEGSP